jgi:hypothetical protein
MRILLLAFLIIFLNGCKEEYPVYSKFYGEKDQKIDCVRIATSYKWIKEGLDDALAQYYNKECAYKLKATLHDVTKCNSSFSSSTPKDFTGYVTLEILKDEKLLYKVQSDFQKDKEASLERVIEKLKVDIF